ncbi:MAG: hypothetical protein MJK12_03660 [Colwellia sp.]|nr:hypothetical protein [Colwellia sp.]
MKLLTKIVPVIISSLLITSAAFTLSANENNKSAADYTLVLLKDCQEISRQVMSDKQLSAYLALEQASEEMVGIESPIESMQDELDQYTAQIEQLTDKAIVEDEHSLHINKAFLKEQEVVVAKLNKLMERHQADFDAIGKQGEKIGEIADEFEKALSESTDGFDYDQVHIETPNDKEKNHQCHSRTYITRL